MKSSVHSDLISVREQEVLKLIAWEHNSKEIAKELFISEHTVITHRKNLLMKLEVKNTAGLVRRAFEYGYLQLSQQVVLMLFLIITSVGYSSAQCSLDDFISLKAIYESTDGDNWLDTTGWTIVRSNDLPPAGCDLSNLAGVTLNGSGLVSELDLGAFGLKGTIPVEISTLYDLTILDLSQNNLYGAIPFTIGDLSLLTHIYLSQNELTGAIPSDLQFLSLNTFDIGENNFTGKLPEFLFSMPTLTLLTLGGNQFNGTIPSKIGPSGIKFLNLYSNKLTGPIPREIANLSTLIHLNINNNQLSGSLPKELGDLAALTSLYVDGNNLSGCFPPNLKNLCTQLNIASIDRDNNFDDTWDNFCSAEAGICDCFNDDWTGLRAIYNELDGDNWTGINTSNWLTIRDSVTRPASFDLTTVPGLGLNADGCVDSIRLRNHDLSGPLPIAIGDIKELRFLNLSRNNITGNIRNSIAALPVLEDLRLHENDLTGGINTNGFFNLRIYSINDNDLAGGIPEELNRLTNLEELWAYDNVLNGQLPATLGGLENLDLLRIENNNISGCFPPNLKPLCSQLTTATLDTGNNLDAIWADFCATEDGSCEDCDTTIKTWTGVINDDWHIADNWNSYCVPSGSDAVIIPRSLTARIYNGAASAGEVLIESSAALTVDPLNTLAIGASSATEGLHNNGTFTLHGLAYMTDLSIYGIENDGLFNIGPSGFLNIDQIDKGIKNSGRISNYGRILTSNDEDGIINQLEFDNYGEIVLSGSDEGITNIGGVSMSSLRSTSHKSNSDVQFTNYSNASILFDSVATGIINEGLFDNRGMLNMNSCLTCIENLKEFQSAAIKGANPSKSRSTGSILDNSGDIIIRDSDNGIVNYSVFFNKAIGNIDLSHVKFVGIENQDSMLNHGDIRIDSSGYDFLADSEMLGRQEIVSGIWNETDDNNLFGDSARWYNQGSIVIEQMTGLGMLNQGEFNNDDSILIRSANAGVQNTLSFINNGDIQIYNMNGRLPAGIINLGLIIRIDPPRNLKSSPTSASDTTAVFCNLGDIVIEGVMKTDTSFSSLLRGNNPSGIVNTGTFLNHRRINMSDVHGNAIWNTQLFVNDPDTFQNSAIIDIVGPGVAMDTSIFLLQDSLGSFINTDRIIAHDYMHGIDLRGSFLNTMGGDVTLEDFTLSGIDIKPNGSFINTMGEIYIAGMPPTDGYILIHVGGILEGYDRIELGGSGPN